MSQSHRVQNEFRADINGLRGWAVAVVVLYHFGVPGFPGGFVGVDVFFVISGFLMTGIIVRGLERREFSLAGFYAARARRIIPALTVLCLVLLASGYFFILPEDYDNLSVHSFFTLVFLSNVRYGRESGYFDLPSTEKWLLHTWSLSVEWQFYLLLPVILLLAWRLMPDRKALRAVIALFAVASSGYCIWLTYFSTSDAFFLLPSRAWELLVGSCVYMLVSELGFRPRNAKAWEIVGLTLVSLSVVGFSKASVWPGWLAIVPVAGASAVIYASRSESPWTGRAPIQWLGSRSYSLYLWHWPIVVALSYFDLQGHSMVVVAGLLVTLVLGDLSFRFIETPSRIQFNRLRPQQMGYVALGLFAVVILPAMYIHNQLGLHDRFSAAALLTVAEAANKRERRDECLTMQGDSSPGCRYGGETLRAVLIGDSHADTVVTALSAAVPNSSFGVIDWSYASCPTLLGVKYVVVRPGVQCDEFLKWALKQLSTIDKHVPLVIVNRFTAYAYGHNEVWEGDANIPGVYFSDRASSPTPEFLREFSDRLINTACLLARGRTVYMMRPIPEMGVDIPKAMSRALAIGRSKEVVVSINDYRARHAVVLAAQNEAHQRCGVQILDPLPYLCPDDVCISTINGRPIYYDDDHLSEFGNQLLIPMFREVFQQK